jgi:hypothetical protein
MNNVINTAHFPIPLRQVRSYTYQIAKNFEKTSVVPVGAPIWPGASWLTQQEHKISVNYCLAPCRHRGKMILTIVTGPHHQCPLPLPP